MEADRIAVIRAAGPAILAFAIFQGPAASAAPSHKLDLPAGRLSAAINVLVRQSGSSISVDDGALWDRQVPALKGSFSVRAALKRLLGDDVELIAVGPDSWRLRRRQPRVVKHRPVIAPRPAEHPDPGDIIVTASKRDTRLRDFTGSVSIIDGIDLNFGGTSGTDAILSRLATVSSTYLGAGRNKLFIRGIADSSFTGPTQATVGQYLGDVRLTYNAPDPDLRLYDVQSVEVLEGPQGTLYGAGSLGGIIRTIPNQPVIGTLGGAVVAGASATEHGEPSGDLAATLNLPIADHRAALRLVGYGIREGGYIDNPLLRRDDINRTAIYGGRGTLRLAIDNDWTVDLGGTVQHTIGDDSQYADLGNPRLERNSPVTEGFSAAYALGQLVIAKERGRIRFRATTAIIGQTLNERYDATPAGGSATLFRQRNQTDLLTNEVRLWQPLGKTFGWVIGTSFVSNKTLLQRALGKVDDPTPVTGVDNRVTEVTLYGEASYRLAPWATVTAGGRISHTDLSGQASDQPAPTSLVDALARAAIVADRQSTSVLPSAALLVTPSSSLSLYARYQESFRPGGLAIDSTFVRRFRGDRVATIEAGIRYHAPEPAHFDLSLAISHTSWRDIQADFLDSSGLPTTDNIGNGRIWSLAASADWRPVPGVRLDASFAFNDGRVTEPNATYRAFLIQAATPINDIDRIPNVARFTVRAGIDWQHTLHDDLLLHLGAWGRYVGRSRIGVGPVLGAEQGDYPDSAVTARIGNGRMGVTLGINNLSDSRGNRFALGTPFPTGRPQITPLRPRTVRLGFDFSF